MIAAGIFLLILLVSVLAIRGRRGTVLLHLVALVAVALLFAHHVTESLGLSF